MDSIKQDWKAFINRWIEPIIADRMSDMEMAALRAEARKIGQAAWDAGGLDFMMQLYHLVPDVMSFPRVVEINWNGIGFELQEA